MSMQRGRARTARLLVLVLLSAGAVLGGDVRSGSADDVNNAQNQLNQDKNKQAGLGSIIDKLNGQISYLTTRVNQLQAALDQVTARIGDQQRQIAASQAVLRKIADDLTFANARLADAKARLDVDQRTLASHMVQLYEEGPTSTLNSILASGNFDDFFTKVNAAKRIADAQRDQVNSVTAERGQVEQLITRIAGDKDQQERVIAQQQATERQLEADKSAEARLQQQLADAKAQDEAQLAANQKSKQEVDAEVAADATALSEAKRKKAEAEAAAAAAAAAAKHHGGPGAGAYQGGGSGKFLWPEQGPISQYFGCTSYPYENYDSGCPYPHRFHTGLDIAASWGTPLAAADTGVVYVYYSSYGYGNHIIIVHDNGYSTLYGHMSSFAVSSGQVVARGQTIGYEGSTGNSSGPHLHFEIRLNNNPQNPLAYLS